MGLAFLQHDEHRALAKLTVGLATVGVFAVWFTRTSFLGIDLGRDGHSTVTLGQLATWGDCEAWDGLKKKRC